MEKKLSNVVKPEGMSAEEWQKKLRSQFAVKEVLSIVPRGDEAVYGVFDVRNPKTKIYIRSCTGDSTAAGIIAPVWTSRPIS